MLHCQTRSLYFQKIDAWKSAMDNSEQSNDLLALTSEIVAAHLSNNTVPLGDLPQLINQVYNSLARYRDRPCRAGGASATGSQCQKIRPARLHRLSGGRQEAQDAEAASEDRLQHVARAYRERWGLPRDYPMVAPNYARQRSRLAKEIGLGTRARAADARLTGPRRADLAREP